MTSEEKAKLLSEHCVDQICSLGDCDDAEMVAKLCCLVEFFEVVEKSYVVLQHCDTTTTGMFELQDALAALRAKLPKEVV